MSGTIWGGKKGPCGPAAEFSCCLRFYPRALGWSEGESTGDKAMCCRGDKAILSYALLPVSPRTHALTHTHPPSSSQALILLASPRARRGVRVGSICLCDGHWCQAPRGLEREERRLVWSGRVTDVSELSSGTSNGAEG